MKTPKVSVLTSCFNSTEFLSEAIESVLAQTFADFEFILIDDGSTDGTLNIIKSHGAKDDRIVVIGKENSGLAESLNVGIQSAKGEWISRLDADDIAMPDRLENQLSYVKDHNQTVLLGSGCIEIDQAGKAVRFHSYPIHHNKLLTRLERLQAFFPHSSSMYHRNTVMKIGGYNRKFTHSQDWDLWLRLSEVGAIACIRQPLLKLRKHANAISQHDGGKRQIVMGTAATFCHFMRLKGASDPSQMSMECWNHFINWLTVRLEQEGIFKAQDAWSELRQQWYAEPKSNILKKGLRLTRGLVGSHQVFKLIQQRLLGANLAAKLADEWIHLESVGELRIRNSKRDN